MVAEKLYEDPTAGLRLMLCVKGQTGRRAKKPPKFTTYKIPYFLASSTLMTILFNS